MGADNPATTPCVRKCCLNEADICLGCFRTFDEIMHWHEASADERLVILEQARLRRAAHKAKFGEFLGDDELPVPDR